MLDDLADGETECDVAVDDDGGSSRLAAWASTTWGYVAAASAAASAPHLLRDRIAEDRRLRRL
jgi:hypothetical protein